MCQSVPGANGAAAAATAAFVTTAAAIATAHSHDHAHDAHSTNGLCTYSEHAIRVWKMKPLNKHMTSVTGSTRSLSGVGQLLVAENWGCWKGTASSLQVSTCLTTGSSLG